MAAIDDRPLLTGRQLEVVGLVARGHPNKVVAARLGISTRGVEAILTRIYEKLNVESRGALIALALSEAGFGLAVGQRASPASPVGALGIPRSLEDEASAYEHAPFMAAVTQGPAHRYTFVNRAAAEVAGRPAERLVGRTVREVYPELEAQFEGALDACYRSGRPWSTGQAANVRWTHEDGSTRDGLVNLIFQPVRDATGEVVGLLHIGAELDEPTA